MIGRLFLAAACAAWAGLARAAGPFSIEAWGGYGMAGMNDVNDNMKNMLKDQKASASGSTGEWTDLAGGVLVGGAVHYALADTWDLGLRVGYLNAGTGKYTFDYSSTTGTTPNTLTTTITRKDTVGATLIPIELGGRYRLQSGKSVFSLGAYVLYGLASGTYDLYDVTNISGTGIYSAFSSSSTSKGTAEATGSGVGGEVLAGWELALGERAYAGLDVGFRNLRVPSLKNTKDVDLDGDGTVDIKKNDAWKDVNDRNLPFAYSGLTAAVKIGYRL